MACGHFSDDACVSGGKRRGFCRLRSTIDWLPPYAGHARALGERLQ
jgi:hypothetical protein